MPPQERRHEDDIFAAGDCFTISPPANTCSRNCHQNKTQQHPNHRHSGISIPRSGMEISGISAARRAGLPIGVPGGVLSHALPWSSPRLCDRPRTNGNTPQTIVISEFSGAAPVDGVQHFILGVSHGRVKLRLASRAGKYPESPASAGRSIGRTRRRRGGRFPPAKRGRLTFWLRACARFFRHAPGSSPIPDSSPESAPSFWPRTLSKRAGRG